MNTTKEEFLRLQTEGKIDVAFALETILADEYRSASLEMVNEIPNITEEQKEAILSYKFKGHTVLEWDLLSYQAQGIDPETGNPNWYEPHTNMIDTMVMAQIVNLTDEQLDAKTPKTKE
jgi:hypothetical protein